MTPFGRKLRELRALRQVTLKDMAAELGVSAAYLSALEHGKRGVPAWYLVQRIIAYFNVIWDEAEELERLAQMSDPGSSSRPAGSFRNRRNSPIVWRATSANSMSAI